LLQFAPHMLHTHTHKACHMYANHYHPDQLIMLAFPHTHFKMHVISMTLSFTHSIRTIPTCTTCSFSQAPGPRMRAYNAITHSLTFHSLTHF
jgi:hypothetical protein